MRTPQRRAGRLPPDSVLSAEPLVPDGRWPGPGVPQFPPRPEAPPRSIPAAGSTQPGFTGTLSRDPRPGAQHRAYGPAPGSSAAPGSPTGSRSSGQAGRGSWLRALTRSSGSAAGPGSLDPHNPAARECCGLDPAADALDISPACPEFSFAQMSEPTYPPEIQPDHQGDQPDDDVRR